MLKLQHITKNYVMGETVIHALRDVSIEFRENEFVSILGPSGCGKTTLLNIIGGLDKYTNGDLIINGKSTKQYTDKDWDTYRNHSIGFVFQSYNLIPHQTVLSNVELALTLSGVSPEERKKRAIAVLEKVGLGDQLYKKPNQMSGGQMQRVAIARALVNDPDILLADEPTGALDSETSVQIMDILKEISKEKLIIMVTHNPELAETYSNRIIRLLDGSVIDDSNPYVSEAETEKKKKPLKKKRSMSFFTALLLSLNNLMTKKGRTFLTSFAGSIGIIGIALILSVSSGVNAYITSIEESTMSSYPLQIQKSTMDANALLSSLMGQNIVQENRDPNKVYSADVMVSMMNAISSGYTENNLEKFKKYLDDKNNGFGDLTTDIKYSYLANLNTYSVHTVTNPDGTTSVKYKPNIADMTELFVELGMMESTGGSPMMGGSSMMMGGGSWAELVGNGEYIASQYDLIHGKYPEKPNEIVIIVDENNQITDYVLYTLGIRDLQEVKDYIKASQEAQLKGEEYTGKIPPTSYTFEEICGYRFKALLDSDFYKLVETKNPLTGEVTKSIVERTEEEINTALDSALELEIVGIISPAEDSVSTVSIGCIGYLSTLMPTLIKDVNGSDVVTAQLANTETDLFTGLPFKVVQYTIADAPMLREMLKQQIGAMVDMMSDEMIVKMVNDSLKESSATYSGNLAKLGYVDFDNPNMISIYPKDFENKERIVERINSYNNAQEENDKITYTDTVALLMSSVTTIINAISYVLIAFVAISLVVSSIMIGIITYISVLERTKEIGILRAIGASKKDISRVFNAETFIVGFAAGVIGIGVTLLLNILINVILYSLTGLATLKATLPVVGAIILVAISVGLTLIAGLIPSRVAAKKDPVIALRTE